MQRECSEYLHVLMPPGAPRDGSLIPTLLTKPWNGFNGSAQIGGTNEKPTYWDDEFKAASPTFDQCGGFAKSVDPGAMRTWIGSMDGDGGVSGSTLWQDANFKYNQIFTGSRVTNDPFFMALSARYHIADLHVFLLPGTLG